MPRERGVAAWLRAERGWSEGCARRKRAVHVDEQKATAAAAARGSAVGPQVCGAAPERPEGDLSGAPELLYGQVDDLRELTVEYAGHLLGPTGVIGEDGDEFNIPNAS